MQSAIRNRTTTSDATDLNHTSRKPYLTKQLTMHCAPRSALHLDEPYLRWLCFFVRTQRQDDVRRLASACRLLLGTHGGQGAP